MMIEQGICRSFDPIQEGTVVLVTDLLTYFLGNSGAF